MLGKGIVHKSAIILFDRQFLREIFTYFAFFFQRRKIQKNYNTNSLYVQTNARIIAVFFFFGFCGSGKKTKKCHKGLRDILFSIIEEL